MAEPRATDRAVETVETAAEPASFRFLCQHLREPGDTASDAGVASRTPEMSAAEWGRVVLAARRHQVGPLLYSRLCATGAIADVPESVREALHRDFLKHAVRNALLYEELGSIVRALSQEGIPVVVLKGGFLAATVYDHIGHRPMGDLDLLVPRSQLMAATAAVRRLGYGFEINGEMPCPDTPEAMETWVTRLRHVPRLFKPPASGVELHWNLLSFDSGWTTDLEALWTRTRPLRLRDLPVHALAPEDLLLHVCLHAAHGNDIALDIGLRPLCDIAAVVRRYGGEMDWTQFCTRAREWNGARGAVVTLGLAADLLGAPVPPHCLSALRPPEFDTRWAALARRQVWTLGERGTLDMPPLLKRTLIELGRLVATPVSGRWRLSFRKVIPSRSEWTSNPTVRPGTPYSWENHRRHMSRMLGRLVRMVAFTVRHPGEAWFLIRTFRSDTRLRAWMKQGP